MDWDKLRVFHAVAAAGSLTHAAEELHLSQSAISRQIRGLEEALGATLFHRHARGLLLTEQGELLFRATAEMKDQLSQASARIRDSKDEALGELKVTTTVGFGTVWLAKRLNALFERYPELSLELILTEQLLDLGMRQADVAIRMSEPQQSDLVRRPLLSARMRFYAAKHYLERHGTPETPADLAKHKLLAYSAFTRSPYAAQEWLGHQLSQDARPVLQMNSYFGMMQALMNGIGIAALPDYIAGDEPSLSTILPDEVSPAFTIFFVYPAELRNSQRVIAFRDFLLSEIENLPKIAQP